MCRPSKIDGRCVDLQRPMIDVKLCCYTCSKHSLMVEMYANCAEGLHFSAFIITGLYVVLIIINPRRACAARVTVVVSCVCVSVCPHTLFWQYVQLQV